MNSSMKHPSRVAWVNLLNNAQFIFFLLLQFLVPLFSFHSDYKGNVHPYSYYLFYTIERSNQIVVNFFPWLFFGLFLSYLLIDRDGSFTRWLPISILPFIFFSYTNTIEEYGYSEDYRTLDPLGTDMLLNRIFLWDLGIFCLIFSIIVYYLVTFFYTKPTRFEDSFERKTSRKTTMDSQALSNTESLGVSNQPSKEPSFTEQSNLSKQNLELNYSPINLLFLMILMLVLPIYSVSINAFLFQPAFFVTPFGLSYAIPFLSDLFFLIYELLAILILAVLIFSIKTKSTNKHLYTGIFAFWIVLSIILFPDILATYVDLFVTYPWLLLPFVIIFSQRKYFFDYAVGLSDEILLRRQLAAIKLFRQSLFIFLLLQISSISVIFFSSLFPIVFSDFNPMSSILNSLVSLTPSLTLVIYPLIFRGLLFDSESSFSSN